nr:3-hydroxyacyl-CoA dehydrogenase NAD-binding domain-containing protein [Nocardioides ungokensis]
MSSLPETVGVYGGGRMGAGIAHAFLVAGTAVTVVENDQAAADAARDRVTASLQRAEERGKLGGPLAGHLEQLLVTTDAGELAGAGLVVEAVPEDPALKVRVLAAVEAAAPEAVLATNTSSLSIDGIAAGLASPERFLGLHFFNRCRPATWSRSWSAPGPTPTWSPPPRAGSRPWARPRSR